MADLVIGQLWWRSHRDGTSEPLRSILVSHPRYLAPRSHPWKTGCASAFQPHDPQRLPVRGGGALPCEDKAGPGSDRGGDGRSHKSSATPSGRLRINAPEGAVLQITDEVILEYLDLYPQMKVDVVTDGRMVDMVSEGFDAMGPLKTP
jgi:hypothetical protein